MLGRLLVREDPFPRLKKRQLKTFGRFFPRGSGKDGIREHEIDGRLVRCWLDACILDVRQLASQFRKLPKALFEELIPLSSRANDGAEDLHLAIGFKTFAKISHQVGDSILFVLLFKER